MTDILPFRRTAALVAEIDEYIDKVSEAVLVTQQTVVRYFRNGPDDALEDRLEQNRTVEVEAEFDDPEVTALLLPGTSADLEVVIDRREGVLAIPTAAVAQDRQVLVVSGERLELRVITPGLSNWRTTEVIEGLAEGELVVVGRDHEGLEPGVEVEVVS